MSGPSESGVVPPHEGCPDDNTMAELVQGVLPAESAAALERHVDGCERCRLLMAELGRLLGPESEPPRAQPGTDLGRYRVKEQLGVGAMGVVYLADDPVLGREVAIKLMRPDLFLSPGGQELRQRFDREARLLAQLSHPNVVTVYDAGETDQGVYIAMEYVPGRTLGQWLQAGNPAGWEVVDVMLQAGRGLEAAHRAGLVHRDVKPDNILVGRDGRARIGDFGLAFQATDGVVDSGQSGYAPRPRGSRLTATGALVGTPAYMAPEQLAGGEVDARSDQYGFCATLFEVLLGRPVSAREEWISTALAGRPQTPVPAGTLPAAVAGVLRKGLRDDPSHRFPDMQTLLLELSEGAVAARWTPKRSLRWALFAAGLVAAVLATVLVLIQVLPQDESAQKKPNQNKPGEGTVARVWPDARAVTSPPRARGPQSRPRPRVVAPRPRPTPLRPVLQKAGMPTLLDFRSAAGGYRIWMPGQPTKQTFRVPTPAGTVDFVAQSVTLKGYGCGRYLGCTFMVGYANYPAKFMRHAIPEKLLSRSRDGAIRNINGKLEKELRVNIDGWPGRILTITKVAPPTVNIKKLTVQARLFMVKNRFYQMQAVCASEHAAAPIIKQVLDSFRLWTTDKKKTTP